MTMIVRGAGVFCWLIASWQVFGLATYLWEKRDTLGSVGGYGQALLPIGLLTVSGILLWVFASRLGRWLGQEPVRRKVRPAAVPDLLPTPQEDEE